MTSSERQVDVHVHESGFVRAVRWLGRAVILRLYALLLIGVIVLLTVLAVRYLVRSLVLPARAPGQITDIQQQLDERVFETARADLLGIAATENPRSPLSHYHRLDNWIQPDLHNGCLTSGCHAPLPHANNKADRAFLNMHATSLHCGMCHMESPGEVLHAGWYDLETGERQGRPSVLQAYDVLLALRTESDPSARKAAREELIALLQAAAGEAAGGQALTELTRHVRAVRADNERFNQLVDAMLAALPRHFRGEYGAKIALIEMNSHAPVLQHPDSHEAVAEFLRSPADSPLRNGDGALSQRIHTRRRPSPRTCSDCHAREESILDFQKLGYPTPRVEQLVEPRIMRAIEHMSRGEPLYLPDFIGRGAQED